MHQAEKGRKSMAQVNLQTWTRVTRLDLAHLTVAIGNAALQNLRFWPATGEGREVKAKSESISRLLEFTHDKKDIASQMEHLEDVISLFQEISQNRFFQSHIGRKRYISRYGTKTNLETAISDYVLKFTSFIKTNKPKREAVSGGTHSPELGGSGSIDANTIAELERITPKQKNAPLQFEFLDGFLQLKRQSSNTKTRIDQKNSDLARHSLENDVKSLVTVLHESNSDQRLIAAVEEMASVISSDSDVIKLGFLSFTCDSLFVRFSEQLSDIASARFLALSTGLGLYVAQFSQWREFVENAA